MLKVYKEIFESSDVALLVGLGIGLALTFISVIIFCIYFYKMKHKYESRLLEENLKTKLAPKKEMEL